MLPLETYMRTLNGTMYRLMLRVQENRTGRKLLQIKFPNYFVPHRFAMESIISELLPHGWKTSSGVATKLRTPTKQPNSNYKLRKETQNFRQVKHLRTLLKNITCAPLCLSYLVKKKNFRKRIKCELNWKIVLRKRRRKIDKRRSIFTGTRNVKISRKGSPCRVNPNVDNRAPKRVKRAGTVKTFFRIPCI